MECTAKSKDILRALRKAAKGYSAARHCSVRMACKSGLSISCEATKGKFQYSIKAAVSNPGECQVNAKWLIDFAKQADEEIIVRKVQGDKVVVISGAMRSACSSQDSMPIAWSQPESDPVETDSTLLMRAMRKAVLVAGKDTTRLLGHVEIEAVGDGLVVSATDGFRGMCASLPGAGNGKALIPKASAEFLCDASGNGPASLVFLSDSLVYMDDESTIEVPVSYGSFPDCQMACEPDGPSFDVDASALRKACTAIKAKATSIACTGEEVLVGGESDGVAYLSTLAAEGDAMQFSLPTEQLKTTLRCFPSEGVIVIFKKHSGAIAMECGDTRMAMMPLEKADGQTN